MVKNGLFRAATCSFSRFLLCKLLWFAINKLTVNMKKCNFINFVNAETVDHGAFGQNITSNASCKYLGILLDNLNFKDHSNYVTKKLNKICGLIYKIGDCYPRRCLLLFFNSYAKTVITYGLLAYGATTKMALQPIENP